MLRAPPGRPPARLRPAGEGARATSIDRDGYLATVAESARPSVSEFLDACDAAGADLSWNKSGPSIFVTRNQRRQVGYLEANRLGVVQTTPTDFPAEPFDAARKQLADAGLGTETSAGWYRSIPLTDPQLGTATAVLLDLISALMPAITWMSLVEPAKSLFTRNDFNIWEAHTPCLESLHGKELRAILTHQPSAASVAVSLVPLAGDQPGWKPVFRPASGRDLVWSATTLGDAFTVEADATGSHAEAH